MIVWCSFCQTYMGEKPPLTNYSLTHSICSHCKSSQGFANRKKNKDIKVIKRFYNELLSAAKSFDQLNIEDVLEKGKMLKIEPLDLFFGIAQPILWEIGDLFERGEITVAKEHLFTLFAQDLLTDLSRMQKKNSASNEDFTILAVPASQNLHTLGVQALGLGLNSNGFSCKRLYPGLPPDELEEFAIKQGFPVVCVSVSEKSQYESTKNLAQKLMEKGCQSKVVLGGPFINKIEAKIESASNFYAFNNLNLLYDFLRAEMKAFISERNINKKQAS